MKVEKINHVAIMVKDLDEAGRFFSDLLNIKFKGPNEAKEADVKNLMSDVGIELVAPLSPDRPAAKTLERRGEGLATLVLKVANLEQAIAHMQARGVRMIGRANLPTAKTAQFHPKDLHGVMIEGCVP